MHTRTLGRGDHGLEVSALGLGCMGMSDFYGPRDEARSLATLAKAAELGCTFWDTADMYGTGRNEELLGKAFRSAPGLRDEVTLATKFAVMRSETGEMLGISGKPEYVREACDKSLQRLGVDHIDLYYQHRVDPKTSIEDTVGAMAELVQAGKVRFLGLSEAAPATLRRAMKVHPITALQTEYSLWTRDLEAEILPTCRELGIGLVPYSPLGRGFLTGAIRKVEDLAEDDWRRHNPRFQGANFTKNLQLVDAVRAIAEEKDCTPAQLALAWVLAQGRDVAPIPGTRSPERLAENCDATAVALSADDLARIEAAFPADAAEGLRYPEAAMASLDG